jgi:hypothetical protein
MTTLQELTEKHNELVRRLVERDRQQAHETHALRMQLADLYDRVDLLTLRLDAVEADR